MAGPTYSIVVPVFNEREVLEQLYERLVKALAELDGSAEVLLIDDGSTDGSYSLMVELHCRDPRFKVVKLSRNFGHQIAITAGLDAAAGDAVVVMDADLQDPPEMIPTLASRWREGWEVIHAVRAARHGESPFKRLTAALFYRALRRVSDVEAPVDAGDFRLVDRKVVEAFKTMRENNRYVRGMFAWAGFKQSSIPYTRAARATGTTKYTFKRMLKFACDAIFSFSNAPLRVALTMGFILSVSSVLAAIVVFWMKVFGAYLIPGWTSIVIAVCFIGGIQLAVLGVVGEYIARIYDEVKNRPLYLVSEAHGVHSGRFAQSRRSVVPRHPNSDQMSVDSDSVAVEFEPRSSTPPR